jgi:hypothetical protein
MKQKNSSSDISPTAGQMPRLLGLAYASKLFRQNSELHGYTTLTNKGNEVALGQLVMPYIGRPFLGNNKCCRCVCRYPLLWRFMMTDMEYRFQRNIRHQRKHLGYTEGF